MIIMGLVLAAMTLVSERVLQQVAVKLLDVVLGFDAPLGYRNGRSPRIVTRMPERSAG